MRKKHLMNDVFIKQSRIAKSIFELVAATDRLGPGLPPGFLYNFQSKLLFMKKILFFLLLVTSELALCQDSLSYKAPKTELERVQIKIGAVIKKEFIKVFNYSPRNIFKGGNFEVNILNLTDASTGLIISGLSVSTTDPGTTYRTFSSF